MDEDSRILCTQEVLGEKQISVDVDERKENVLEELKVILRQF